MTSHPPHRPTKPALHLPRPPSTRRNPYTPNPSPNPNRDNKPPHSTPSPRSTPNSQPDSRSPTHPTHFYCYDNPLLNNTSSIPTDPASPISTNYSRGGSSHNPSLRIRTPTQPLPTRKYLTPNGTPSTLLPHSRPKPMTYYRRSRRPPYYHRTHHVIPLQLPSAPNHWPNLHHPSYIPMMTRHCTRKHLPRPPHPPCPKRPTIWYSPVHYIRSFLFPRVLLSILPLKPGPNSRARGPMTASRDQTSKPNRSPPTKHRHPPSLWGNRHMSSPQHHRSQPKTSNSSSNSHSPPRILLHRPPSYGVLRSPLHHRRRSLRLNILCGHRIPRLTCNHWLYIPPSMPSAPNQIPLYIKPPLWL